MEHKKLSKAALGKYIEKRRTELGMSREELARRLNVSYHVLWRWENGKRFPDYEMIDRLAKELEVSLDELYYSAEEGKDSSVLPTITSILVVTLIAGAVAGAVVLGILHNGRGREVIPAASSATLPTEDFVETMESEEQNYIIVKIENYMSYIKGGCLFEVSDSKTGESSHIWSDDENIIERLKQNKNAIVSIELMDIPENESIEFYTKCYEEYFEKLLKWSSYINNTDQFEVTEEDAPYTLYQYNIKYDYLNNDNYTDERYEMAKKVCNVMNKISFKGDKDIILKNMCRELDPNYMSFKEEYYLLFIRELVENRLSDIKKVKEFKIIDSEEKDDTADRETKYNGYYAEYNGKNGVVARLYDNKDSSNYDILYFTYKNDKNILDNLAKQEEDTEIVIKSRRMTSEEQIIFDIECYEGFMDKFTEYVNGELSYDQATDSKVAPEDKYLKIIDKIKDYTIKYSYATAYDNNRRSAASAIIMDCLDNCYDNNKEQMIECFSSFSNGRFYIILEKILNDKLSEARVVADDFAEKEYNLLDVKNGRLHMKYRDDYEQVYILTSKDEVDDIVDKFNTENEFINQLTSSYSGLENDSDNAIFVAIYTSHFWGTSNTHRFIKENNYVAATYDIEKNNVEMDIYYGGENRKFGAFCEKHYNYVIGTINTSAIDSLEGVTVSYNEHVENTPMRKYENEKIQNIPDESKHIVLGTACFDKDMIDRAMDLLFEYLVCCENQVFTISFDEEFYYEKIESALRVVEYNKQEYSTEDYKRVIILSAEFYTEDPSYGEGVLKENYILTFSKEDLLGIADNGYL